MKVFTRVSLILMMVLLFISSSYGEGHQKLSLDGILLDFDITPSQFDEKTLIPLSFFSDNYNLMVEESRDQVTLYYKDSYLVFSPGSKMGVRDGSFVIFSIEPLFVNREYLVPFFFMVDFLGLYSSLDEKGVVALDRAREGLNLFLILPKVEYSREHGVISAKLLLVNNTDRREVLSFRTGQRFDLFLFNEKNERVLVWSRGQVFIQALGTLELEPGEEVSFAGALDISRLAPGTYELQGMITGTRRFSPLPLESNRVTLTIN